MRKKRATKRPSLRGAINEMCKSCIYDNTIPGGWLVQVRDCTSPGCPIYPVRPRPEKRAKETSK